MTAQRETTSDASGGATIGARVRSVLALSGALLMLATAASAFWYQDWRYSLPTPRPPDLAEVPLGTSVAGPPAADDGRPVFLHFTSPECPCSRFARDHVRALLRALGERTRFLVVEEAEAGDESGARTELGIPRIADPGGRIAARFGVYSTPQAVILAPDGSLWYRGNYNAARFCTDPATAYARLALEALLLGDARPAFPASATTAYGCALPGAEAAE